MQVERPTDFDDSAASPLQVERPTDFDDSAASPSQYWGGYHWKLQLNRGENDRVVVYNMMAVCSKSRDPPRGMPVLFLPKIKVRAWVLFHSSFTRCFCNTSI